ncbi:MAG: hypothetical protein HC921_20070 [Synechococcaceae cyanobacterium SM2_3_1]|nr:hypothetical protein [Synechococcaceae cyanobacterium SM2_3_1]
MQVEFWVVQVPLVLPLQAPDLEKSVIAALESQVGALQLLRWAITSVQKESTMVTVEAVITITG